ncbi:MAG: anaerobic ribonucleoside-triphosphate reductase activating protein [Clostridia bacterium]|nr:anaerobic ribonucleoside-triphosphate reductase activating protein [Clostridia bacterium]
MNYGAIKETDIANGVGVRVSLFVSGCTHHCKNCFNPETWDFNYGEVFDEAVQTKMINLLSPSFINGLSLLGGEPLEAQNQRALLPFVKKVKEKYPQKDIWCYSGYTFETDILSGKAHCEVTDELLAYIDVLVDGEFVEEKKNIMLKFRGSENQRIIDVQKSLEMKKTVLKEL